MGIVEGLRRLGPRAIRADCDAATDNSVVPGRARSAADAVRTRFRRKETMKTWTLASANRWIHRARLAVWLMIALFGWLGLAASLFVTTERAAAATYTWDSDGNDANNAQDGGGTWST